MAPTSPHDARDTVTWPELLALAATPQEVVGIALDFFASLTPQDVNSLPSDCVPPHRLSEPEQVVDYAFRLVRQRCRLDVDNTVLFRLANFFSHAARRVAQLMSEVEPIEAANAPAVKNDGPFPRPDFF
jgi:hypothetical protein